MAIASSLHRLHRSDRPDRPPRPHPLERLSWAERLRWAGKRRTTHHALDTLQLRILRGMAADQAAVYSIRSAHPAGHVGDSSGQAARAGEPGQVRAVELRVGERRVVGRVGAEVEVSLAEAIRSGPVRVVGAARYGPYWTLTFRTALETLIVLADRVVLLPGSGGVAGDLRRPGLRVGG